jgi:hypothetical protein
MLALGFKQVNDPPPNILTVMPNCPGAVAVLLQKMMRKDRAQRHASYQDLLSELAAVHSSLEQAQEAAQALKTIAIQTATTAPTSVQEVEPRQVTANPPPALSPSPPGDKPRSDSPRVASPAAEEPTRFTPERLRTTLIMVAMLGGLVFMYALWCLIRPSKVSELRVDSPPGATLWVNGKTAGTVPWRGRIPVNTTNAVTVSNKFLGAISQMAVARQGKSAACDFSSRYGVIQITANNAPGATVRILTSDRPDDPETTPFTNALKPGKHTVVLERSGFEEAIVAVLVQANTTTNLDVELNPIGDKPVSVEFRLNPAIENAILTDNRGSNDDHGRFFLKPGEYQFQVQLPAPCSKVKVAPVRLKVGHKSMTTNPDLPVCSIELDNTLFIL